MVTRRPISLLALAGLALTACSGSASSPDVGSSTEPEQSASVTPDSEPDEIDEPVAIPAEFPSAVPIPAGLEVEGAEVLEGTQNRLFDLTGWHPADPVPTGTAYLAELDELGYAITSQTDADTSVFFIAEGPEWVVSAGFFPDPVRLEGTSVGITISPRTG